MSLPGRGSGSDAGHERGPFLRPVRAHRYRQVHPRPGRPRHRPERCRRCSLCGRQTLRPPAPAGHGFEMVAQPGARPAVPIGQARHLLDERLPGALFPVAEVPAHPETDQNPPRVQRPFVEAALVRAVHASRLLPTVWALARPTGGRRIHRQRAGGVADTLHSYSDPGSQHILYRLARHARKHTAEAITRPAPDLGIHGTADRANLGIPISGGEVAHRTCPGWSSTRRKAHPGRAEAD
ncbi:hypothetical protein BX281_9382 [Streptomyces sp. Ag82_O1-15]|nr:hypothetical protein BX281_9382 [Streptomyces sp. Ag82_O1-15]